MAVPIILCRIHSQGGKTNIRESDPEVSQRFNNTQGKPFDFNQTLQRTANHMQTIQNPEETLSAASSAYVGRSKAKQIRNNSANRSKRSQVKGEHVRVVDNMHVYLPVGYFQYTGYLPSENKRQRFNEEIEQTRKNQDDNRSLASKRSQRVSKSLMNSDGFKQRVIERIGQLNDNGDNRLAAQVAQSMTGGGFGRASTITHDNIRHFDVNPRKYDIDDDAVEFDDQNQGDENRDEVRENGTINHHYNNQSAERKPATYKKRTIISADGSVRSTKTYISTLEQQLTKERRERERLEREVEELRKISSEISSKLGLSTQSNHK
ncbi:UNKNOWN [Stylonychia lemnae]|uniref:Uncharacterized protein n=1 Tax=Stylonychia lemnae TaxID=5949 RepID=A0A078B3X3_STYLE|nr:UNKNOWN [Stylonychia lemnae]|eukprot:CDW89194.1 UNKNOWN [Stylonychia lemnae]